MVTPNNWEQLGNLDFFWSKYVLDSLIYTMRTLWGAPGAPIIAPRFGVQPQPEPEPDLGFGFRCSIANEPEPWVRFRSAPGSWGSWTEPRTVYCDQSRSNPTWPVVCVCCRLPTEEEMSSPLPTTICFVYHSLCLPQSFCLYFLFTSFCSLNIYISSFASTI